MTETLYRKKGRRYLPIGIHEDARHTHYPMGASLVWARPDGGGVLTRYGIEPADAALLAASERVKDVMIDAMRNASYMRPTGAQGRRPLTEKQKRAWKAYVAVAGEESSLILQGASLSDIAEAGINVLREAVFKQEQK
jgi:hypothetical protein